jgi:hypothetical protein
MTTIANLVGFCRQIPDIGTFVIPTFVLADGSLAYQHDVHRDARVAEFLPISTRAGFNTTTLELGTKIGNAMLYGFELSNRVIIGHGSPLARFLDERLKFHGDYFVHMPNTVATIRRFVEFIGAQPHFSGSNYVFELTQLAESGVFVPAKMTFEQEAESSDEAHGSDDALWSDALLIALTHERVDQAAHRSAKRALACKVEAEHPRTPAAEASLNQAIHRLLTGARLLNGKFVTRNDEVLCRPCLFDLLTEYVSPSTIGLVMNIAESLERQTSGLASGGGSLHSDAMRVAEVYFSRESGSARGHEAYSRYVRMRELQAGFLYMKNQEQEYPVVFDYDAEINADERINADFDDTLESSVERGRNFGKVGRNEGGRLS